MATLPKILTNFDKTSSSRKGGDPKINLTNIASALGVMQIQQGSTFKDMKDDLKEIKKETTANKKFLKEIAKNTKPKKEDTKAGASTKAPSDTESKKDSESSTKKEDDKEKSESASLGGLAAGGTLAAVMLGSDMASDVLGKLGNEKVDPAVVARNEERDYKAAGNTLQQAGFTSVTGRTAINPSGKELQPADFEQAQQAQAAREALQRGLRDRKGQGKIRTAAELSDEVYQGADTTPNISAAKEVPDSTGNANVSASVSTTSLRDVSTETQPPPIVVSPNLGPMGGGTFYKTKVPLIQARRENVQPTADTVQNITPQPVDKELKIQTVDNYDAGKFRTVDRASFNSMQQRQRDIEKELLLQKQSEIQAAPNEMSRNVILEKIKGEAEERAKTEFSEKIRAAGAGSTSSKIEPNIPAVPPIKLQPLDQGRARDIGGQVRAITSENSDLNRTTQTALAQPVIVNNTSAISTETQVPMPAAVRSSSTFQRYADRVSSY